MTRSTFSKLAAAALGVAGLFAVPAPCAFGQAATQQPAARPAANNMPRAATQMAAAAHNFWTSLTPEQQQKCGFQFSDQERYNWHFIPRERKGITWNDMTPSQQALAHAFLASGLSQRAYMQAETIMSLDQILKEMEAGKGPKRDSGNYAFSIFGTPDKDATWGWRVEGHHLSVNITIADGKVAVGGPIFLGSNPAEVREGPRKGVRVLASEEDMGFKLINALDADQKKKAIIEAKAPNEIITSNSRKANPGEPKGIAFADLNADQKKQMTALVRFYAQRLRPELAVDDVAKVEKAGWDKVFFAWAGATEPGEGHYYRVHGPTFLIEFDNTQNNANHVHTVWRDATNDFGEDLLKEHYDASHANK